VYQFEISFACRFGQNVGLLLLQTRLMNTLWLRAPSAAAPRLVSPQLKNKIKNAGLFWFNYFLTFSLSEHPKRLPH
jgi:hypothetical protein